MDGTGKIEVLMTQRKQFTFQHVGALLLLVLLATLRPNNIFPWWPISLEPVAFLSLVLLCIYKIFVTVGFKAVWQGYWLQIVLFAAYQFVCLFSLYLNANLYDGTPQLLRHGVHYIVMFSAVPIALLLFSLPASKHKYSLSQFEFSRFVPSLLIAFIALLTIWQSWDYQSAKLLSQLFVSSEIWPDNNINAIFKVNTDLGSLLAISLVFSLCVLSHKRNALVRYQFAIAFVLVGVIFIAGMLTGSRSFILSFFIGLLVLLFSNLKKGFGFRHVIAYFLLLIAVGHLVILMSPYALLKMGTIFPYIRILAEGEVLAFVDILPQFTDKAFGGRIVIWSDSIRAIAENPWFGLSNGGARLSVDTQTLWNSHNLIIQILLDAGFVGFTLMTILVGSLIIKIKKGGECKAFLPVILTVLVTLSFDYFLDHSLPWIIISSYILCSSYRLFCVEPQPATNSPSRQSSVVPVVAVAAFLFAGLIANYWHKNLVNQEKSIESRVTGLAETLVKNYNDLIFVDERFKFSTNEIREGTGWRFNPIATPVHALTSLCEYAVPDSAFILGLKQSELTKAKIDYQKYYVNRSSSAGGVEGFVTIKFSDLDCNDFGYSQLSTSSHKDWFANRMDIRRAKDRKDWPLWGYIKLVSKIHHIPKGDYTFSFKAKGRYGVGDWPKLKLSVIGVDGEVLAREEVVSVKAEHLVEYTFSIQDNSTGFLQMEFINDAWDESINEDRAIFIEPKSIQIEKIERINRVSL